jgi:hypothetical protein
MGWIHSKERNKLLPATTEMTTAVKMHYDSFAPVKLSSTQQAKRARFDAAVASSIGSGESLAGAAQLPDELLSQIEENRGAVAAAADAAAATAAEQGEGEELEELTATELGAQIDRVSNFLSQSDALTPGPPEGFATWTEAVEDAFGSWDLGLNLADPNYTEVFAAPVVAVRAPTTNQFDPAALVQEDLQQQQQEFAAQQRLLQGFQFAAMPNVAASMQQHMQQQYMQM